MAAPLILGPVVAALGRFAMSTGVAAGIVAGILRVMTLLGIGVAVYEGIDTLLPYFESLLVQAEGYASSGGASYALLGQVMALLKVQEAISLVAGAIGTRITFRASLILTRSATGGA